MCPPRVSLFLVAGGEPLRRNAQRRKETLGRKKKNGKKRREEERRKKGPGNARVREDRRGSTRERARCLSLLLLFLPRTPPSSSPLSPLIASTGVVAKPLISFNRLLFFSLPTGELAPVDLSGERFPKRKNKSETGTRGRAEGGEGKERTSTRRESTEERGGSYRVTFAHCATWRTARNELRREQLRANRPGVCDSTSNARELTTKKPAVRLRELISVM